MKPTRQGIPGANRAPRWLVFAVALPLLILAMPESAAAAVAGEPESAWATVARLANFAILVGMLVYFLKRPLMGFLADSGVRIRQDLVAASEMRTAAAAQLAEIQHQLQALPAELAALERQGAEDVVSEQARIAQAAAIERERLLEQTRREIDLRLRVARRELTEHAATLTVAVAEARIRQTITPDDQLRLLDRYAAQLREAR
jgi:F-type H+-transporting ATPase subunit b